MDLAEQLSVCNVQQACVAVSGDTAAALHCIAAQAVNLHTACAVKPALALGLGLGLDQDQALGQEVDQALDQGRDRALILAVTTTTSTAAPPTVVVLDGQASL